MREIVFDTETTGLDNRQDRIVEIGAVELVNRFPTGRTFHTYLNAGGRKVHPDAAALHGLDDDFLADKPSFAEIVETMDALLDGATLVAHNAGFDIGFLNAEYVRAGLPPVDPGRVVDTLAIARRRHPIGPNSLDALCKRYGVDNAHRTRHGALLDAELLADVYIEMSGGRQAALGLGKEDDGPAPRTRQAAGGPGGPRPEPLAARLSEEERAAHLRLVEDLGAGALWNRYGS